MSRHRTFVDVGKQEEHSSHARIPKDARDSSMTQSYAKMLNIAMPGNGDAFQAALVVCRELSLMVGRRAWHYAKRPIFLKPTSTRRHLPSEILHPQGGAMLSTWSRASRGFDVGLLKSLWLK